MYRGHTIIMRQIILEMLCSQNQSTSHRANNKKKDEQNMLRTSGKRRIKI